MNTEISMTIPSRRNSTLITTLVLTAVAMVIPFLISGYQRTLIQKGLLWIPAIFGVYILYSLLRQVHFGQSIFIGIGSYITAFLAGKYDVTNELLILLPAALVISIVVAYVLGIFITKRTGFYFAVMGIAVTMVFWSLVYKARAITGGSDGISHIKNPSLFTIPLNDLGLYYVCLFVTVGMILLMLRILNSSFSLQLRAIAGDLDKAESIGIPVNSMLRMAFVIAGAYAGVTGVLLAFSYNYVGPSTFDWGYGANFVQCGNHRRSQFRCGSHRWGLWFHQSGILHIHMVRKPLGDRHRIDDSYHRRDCRGRRGDRHCANPVSQNPTQIEKPTGKH